MIQVKPFIELHLVWLAGCRFLLFCSFFTPCIVKSKKKKYGELIHSQPCINIKKKKTSLGDTQLHLDPVTQALRRGFPLSPCC